MMSSIPTRRDTFTEERKASPYCLQRSSVAMATRPTIGIQMRVAIAGAGQQWVLTVLARPATNTAGTTATH